MMGTYLIDLEKILEAALKVFQAEADRHNITLCNDDLEWEAWPQIWGSTALGYGGIGGQAFTHAQTVIVRCTQIAGPVAVFFGRPRLAYVANGQSPAFIEAYKNKEMPSCRDSKEIC